MGTSLPWLRDRGLLSSRRHETGKCFCLLDFIVLHGWRGAGSGWEAKSHEDFRVVVILGGVGTEINRVLMMMVMMKMEAQGQFLMSFCVSAAW